MCGQEEKGGGRVVGRERKRKKIGQNKKLNWGREKTQGKIYFKKGKLKNPI